MRNPALERLEPLVGTWDLTLTNAWFAESMEDEQHGEAAVRWLGDAHTDASEDAGQTWRKDFDLFLRRRAR